VVEVVSFKKNMDMRTKRFGVFNPYRVKDSWYPKPMPFLCSKNLGLYML